MGRKLLTGCKKHNDCLTCPFLLEECPKENPDINKGRPYKIQIDTQRVAELKHQGKTQMEAAKTLGCNARTLRKRIRWKEL